MALVRSCPIIRYTDHIREEKRNALYVSFSESKEQFNDNSGRLGMDFTGHEKNGDFVYQHCLVQPESAKLVLLSNSLQKGSEMGNQGYTFHWKSQATTPIDFIQPASMKN